MCAMPRRVRKLLFRYFREVASFFPTIKFFSLSAVKRAMQPILESLLDRAGKLNGKATSTVPKPKIPDNDIEPSGHNSTRPNEALFINIIPEELNILQQFCSKNNMPWRTPVVSNSKDQEIVTANKSISQELTLAIEMYNSSLPWIYQQNSFYINLFAYDIAWQWQPNMIGFMSYPISKLNAGSGNVSLKNCTGDKANCILSSTVITALWRTVLAQVIDGKSITFNFIAFSN